MQDAYALWRKSTGSYLGGLYESLGEANTALDDHPTPDDLEVVILIPANVRW